MIKNLSAFVSGGSFGKSIEGVLVMPDRVVATDSFKLIEIEQENAVSEPVVVKMPKGLKSFEDLAINGRDVSFSNKGGKFSGEVIDQEFPKYEAIIPEGEPVLSINLSPAHLKEIIAAFDKDLKINLKFYGENKVVVITGPKKRVLLMPINN